MILKNDNIKKYYNWDNVSKKEKFNPKNFF